MVNSNPGQFLCSSSALTGRAELLRTEIGLALFCGDFRKVHLGVYFRTYLRIYFWYILGVYLGVYLGEFCKTFYCVRVSRQVWRGMAIEGLLWNIIKETVCTMVPTRFWSRYYNFTYFLNLNDFQTQYAGNFCGITILKVKTLGEGQQIWKNLPPVLTKQLFLLSSVKTSGIFFQLKSWLKICDFRKALAPICYADSVSPESFSLQMSLQTTKTVSWIWLIASWLFSVYDTLNNLRCAS